MQKISFTKKSKGTVLVKMCLWSAFHTPHREKPRGSIPAGSAREEKQPLCSCEMTFSMKRGHSAIKNNYLMSTDFQEAVAMWESSRCVRVNPSLLIVPVQLRTVMPSSCNGACCFKLLIWKKCTVGEHECWLWCFVLAHPYKVGCSDSLTRVGEILTSFLHSVWKSVSRSTVGLKRVTVCHAWWATGEGV